METLCSLIDGVHWLVLLLDICGVKLVNLLTEWP